MLATALRPARLGRLPSRHPRERCGGNVGNWYIYIYIYINYTRAQRIDWSRSTSYNQLSGNNRRNSVPRPRAARVGLPNPKKKKIHVRSDRISRTERQIAGNLSHLTVIEVTQVRLVPTLGTRNHAPNYFRVAHGSGHWGLRRGSLTTSMSVSRHACARIVVLVVMVVPWLRFSPMFSKKWGPRAHAQF
jgi:hypothetical protein